MLDVRTVKSKLKEQILQKLNQGSDARAFEKEDLEDVAIVSEFSQDAAKRVFMVKLRLSAKVLFSPRALALETLGIEEKGQAGKMESVGKRSASKEFKTLAEKEMEKEV